jgi:hypothetical protein
MVTIRMPVMSASTVQRARFRIRFPLAERPRLFVGGVEHIVIDCSERGLRFVLREGQCPRVGTDIDGQLQFRCGRLVAVCGSVVRVVDDHVAVQFTTSSVPFGVILDEQRRLRKRCPLTPADGHSPPGREPGQSAD